MDNPIKMMMWLNANAMAQYLELSKTMLDVFFPVRAQSKQPAPALVPATVPVKARVKRMGCIGPADLRS